jgi:hypothetical protein
MAISGTLHIVDLIPRSESDEHDQNAEPSLAVDPKNAANIIAGSFDSDTPYFITFNAGNTWSPYDSLNTEDKSLAWKADGSGFITATLVSWATPQDLDAATINLYSGTANSIFSFIDSTSIRNLDQPWIRTGQSNHFYVTYNDTSNPGGQTASVLVYNGSSYNTIVLDGLGGQAPGFHQDAPSVRLAVYGDPATHVDTVYAAFTRWTSVEQSLANGDARLGAYVIVRRDDKGGADNFNDLKETDGTIGANVFSQGTVAVWGDQPNTGISLGEERVSSDLAIAVDPSNRLQSSSLMATARS